MIKCFCFPEPGDPRAGTGCGGCDMAHRNSKGRVQSRRENATARQAERAARGDAGQLARLDAAGHTATRERARLAARAK